MKTNKIIRTLKGFNKGIFKALNMAYGFNFEKDFCIEEIKTPFTIKKAVDAIPAKYNELGRGGRVVILVKYPEDYYGYRKNRVYGVEVIDTGASDFNICFRGRIEYPYSTALDDFYRKGDFNEARKDSAVKAYIVAQTSANLGKFYKYPEPIKNYTERDFDNAGTERGYGYDYETHKYTKFVTIVDKSGYHVELKQQELKNKAKQIRTERQKAAYKATDNTAKIEEIKKRVEIAKTIVIERLKIATTYDNMRQIRNDALFELGYAFMYLETLTGREREKEFTSIDAFNSCYDDIERCVNKIIAWSF